MLALAITGRPAISFVGWLVINDVIYMFCGCCSFTKSWKTASLEATRRREPAWRRSTFRRVPPVTRDSNRRRPLHRRCQ